MPDQLPIRMVIRDYNQIGPLVKGDVVVEGIDLTIDRQSSIQRFRDDHAFDVGETSMSQYLLGLANDDQSIVGLPVFPVRAFRHRCFFVRRDSGFDSFKSLEGGCIGTNGWTDTGNTWSRAAMRAEGVDLGAIRWWVGSTDGVTDERYGHRASPDVPAGVTFIGHRRTLLDMLLADELDALMVPWPPINFYDPASPIVRLFPNYLDVEEAYFRRTGVFPGHHIIGIRYEIVDKYPWVVRNLYEGLEAARIKSGELRWRLTDNSPWELVELERTRTIMGADWHPNGVEPNRKMIETFCEEQWAQGLVSKKVDASKVFDVFKRLMDEPVCL